MILSDKTIQELALSENLVRPFSTKNLQGASYDLTLGRTFYELKEQFKGLPVPFNIPDFKEFWKKVEPNEEGNYIMLPGMFYLATTEEVVNLPNTLAGQISGRSSIGRTGLFIQNAGWIDPEFKGQITLELFNAGDIAINLSELDRVAQITFMQLDEESTGYKGKYQNQLGTTVSKLYQDKEKTHNKDNIDKKLKGIKTLKS